MRRIDNRYFTYRGSDGICEHAPAAGNALFSIHLPIHSVSHTRSRWQFHLFTDREGDIGAGSEMKARLNIIGPQVRRLRCNLNWSQNDLAIKLQVHGWDVCRQTVARIEAQEMWVGDFEIFYLAEVLKVSPWDLYPKIEPRPPVHEVLNKLLGRSDGTASSEGMCGQAFHSAGTLRAAAR